MFKMIKKPIEILCLMTVTWVYEWQMDIGHWTALVSKGSKLSMLVRTEFQRRA